MKPNLLALSLLFSITAFCQTGPGGVGATNGTSNLVLWLDANTVSGTNGATITTWPDMSGYGYNFTVGNGAVLTKPAQNGKAAFTFNGTSHYFERAYTANLSPASYTIFTAEKVTTSGNYKAIISNRSASPQQGYILYSSPTDNFWQFWTGDGGGWDFIGTGNSTHGVWASQVTTFQSATGDKELYVNEGTPFTSTQTAVPNSTYPIRVGAGTNETSPDFYYPGDIGEVIIYNTVLNSAQRIIVDNYLASKYNFTLTSNDLFINDNAGNGNYDTDMAGIGRINASNQHTDAQGGIVRILNATNLGDDEFLFWGHDNAQQEAKNTTDVPAGVVARFHRTWRANEVNTAGSAITVGNIDIRWDLSIYGSVTVTDLRLLIDTDNDGLFADETPVSGAVSLGGGIYAFTGVTAMANNLRFTLATINTIQTPLPILLAKFNAVPINKKQVLITWTTSTESNNDYFTVERSKDNVTWEEVKRVDGAGNSSTVINYSAIDDYPYTDISFYRVKQTDLDGKYTYSNIKSVNLPKTGNYIVSIYPNPAYQEVTVMGDEEELKEIIVYNIIGQNITSHVRITKINSGYLKIDLTRLKPGMYSIKTKNAVQNITKQ